MKKTPPKRKSQFVLITGLSGSGKGSVLRAFEDLGFYCVDNLPVDLIPKFAELSASGRIERAAVVADVREGAGFGRLPNIYEKLSERHPRPSLVFLEASEAALIRRFQETRRPHPLGRNLPVREGIRLERDLLKPMRQLSDAVVDTSRMNVHQLREFIETRYGGRARRRERKMLVSVLSFGFRFGVPADADLLFDVRFLPNPNYVPRLKKKTGRDRSVQRFMDSYPQVAEFVRRITNLLVYLLPHYIREGKSYLTVAFGCTGGRHRSVAIALRVAGNLAEEGYEVKISHRDVDRSAG